MMYMLGEHWGDSAAANAGLSGCVVDFHLPQFLSLPVKPLLVQKYLFIYLFMQTNFVTTFSKVLCFQDYKF